MFVARLLLYIYGVNMELIQKSMGNLRIINTLAFFILSIRKSLNIIQKHAQNYEGIGRGYLPSEHLIN